MTSNDPTLIIHNAGIAWASWVLLRMARLPLMVIRLLRQELVKTCWCDILNAKPWTPGAVSSCPDL